MVVLANYYSNQGLNLWKLDSIFKSDTKTESKLEDLETMKSVKHIEKGVQILKLNISLISEKNGVIGHMCACVSVGCLKKELG